MNSFYSRKELEEIGFAKLGYNVLISKKTSIYGAADMIIGDNVRIDDFCFLMGKIKLGNYIHIAPYSNLVGGDAGIEMQDFSGVSSRVSIYAVSDDYSGAAMTNPTVPKEYTNVIKGTVIIEKHSIIGASSVVLPGVVVREGSSCGAMSLITKSTEPWSINVGIPARKKGDRKQDLLKMEQEFIDLLQADMNKEFYEGQESHILKTVTSKDIELFASVSGDTNPVHLNEEYAQNSVFKRRVAHGMLSGAYISAVLGSQFPGNGTIYLEQNLKFLKPVYIGDELDIGVRIVELKDRDCAKLKTIVKKQDGTCVVEGEALVKLPPKR